MIKFETKCFIFLTLFSVHGFKFYVYDWPANITDVYPNSSVPLVRGPPGRGGLVTIYKHHRYRRNNFFGDLVQSDVGLYDTFAWGLFKLIYTRLLKHPLRTLDTTKADAFFVPFDIGFNGIINTEHGRERGLDWHGCDKAPYATTLLEKEFKKNSKYSQNWGHDHFLVFDFCNAQHLANDCYNFLKLCINCTILSIETLNYKTPYLDYLEELSKVTSNPLPPVKRWMGVPFPASIHWHDGIDKESPPWTFGKFNRDRLAIFWGNPQVLNRSGSRLRKVLIAQCEAANSQECLHFGSGPHGRSHHVVKELLYYTNATFCLQPTGDAETRKAIFDCLLLGGIPVVFTPQLMHRVYPWFFSVEESRDTSFYIPMDDMLKKNMNVLEILRAVPKSEIMRMQKAIEKIAPRLQFAAPPTSLAPLGHWTPPFNDALDVILDKVEQRIVRFKDIGDIPKEDIYVKKSFAQAIFMGKN